jgi:hypothetical protein
VGQFGAPLFGLSRIKLTKFSAFGLPTGVARLGIKTPLKQVSHTPVPSIEVNRVSRCKPMHPAAEVGSMTLGDQMVVIAHQNIPVQRHVVAIERFNKQLHEFRAVHFVSENALPPIPSSANMIKRSFKLQSQRPRHDELRQMETEMSNV